MKYWVFQNNQVVGPFDREAIGQLPGFSADSLICPEGRKGTQMGDWQRAGVVPELADALMASTRVPAMARAAAERAPSGGGLPPEPTLRDLAVLGSLQERVGLLEGSLTRVLEELKGRDAELSRLKLELDQKGRAASELQARVAELEGKAASLATVRDELTAAKDELAKTRDEAHRAAGQVEAQERTIAELRERLGRPPMEGPRPEPMRPVEPPVHREPFRPEIQPFGAPAQTPPMAAPDTAPPMARKPQVGGMGKLGSLESGADPFAPAGAVPERAPEPALSLGSLPSLSPDLARPSAGEAPKPRRDKKVFAIIAAMAALATTGVYLAGGKKKARLAAPPDAVPAPATTPMPAPAASVDHTHEAVDFAKNYAIPGRTETLSQLLEARYPTNGRLSPWMVEKLDDDKYQVNFWASQSESAAPPKPVFQFDVHPRARLLQGLNEPAVALLKDGAVPAAESGRAKRVRRARRSSSSPGSIDAVAAVLEGLKAGQKQGRRARRKAAAAAHQASQQTVMPSLPGQEPPPSGMDAASSKPEPAAPAKTEEEQTLDQLLLPGFDPGKPVTKKR